jgi:hypothetical protein
MADDAPSSGGWLPPVAPGGNPPPRFDAPQWAAPRPAEPRPATPQGPPAPRPPRLDAPEYASNGAAVWALVLGIAGLALLLISFGTLFFITLPLSAASWTLATRARAAIAEGRTATGEGQAIAALWLGRAGVIAGVAAAVVLITLIASGFDFEEFRQDLERELDRRRQQEDGGVDGVRTAIEGLRAVAGR